MDITEVRVKLLETDGKLKGIANVTFEHVFVVNDIRIIEGDNGLFIAMPSKKTQSGVFKDICHPIEKNFRQKLESLILNKFHEEVKINQ